MDWKEFDKLSNKQKCLIMWEWIAEDGSRYKEDFFEYLKMPEYHCPQCLCYACDQVLTQGFTECSNCPIKWTGSLNGGCLDGGSPYNLWDTAESHIEAKKYAKKIVKLIKTTWEE